MEETDLGQEFYSAYAAGTLDPALRLLIDTRKALTENQAIQPELDVWRKAEQYDPAQASPTTWIFRIARNRHIDAFRRQRHLDAQPDEPMLSPAELPEPEESYQLLEIEENVREALKTLPAEQVELVRASFYEGLSHSEIAERKQLPLGTVKSRIRLAFERLRSTLSREL